MVTPSFIEGAAWDQRAANARLSKIGNIVVSGLIDDQGQPVLQNLSASYASPWGFSSDKDELKRLQSTATNDTIFHKISRVDCLLQYATAFGNRSSLTMVSSDTSSANNSLLSYGLQTNRGRSAYEPAYWMCQTTNTFSCKKLVAHGYQSREEEEAATSDWNMFGSKIEYCLASYQPTQDKCSVVYSYTIMISTCLPSGY